MHLSRFPRLLLPALLFLTTTGLKAQNDLPEDYLSKDFHKGRREAARALLPANSVMVVAAAPLRNYANDVDYNYHQNPDLFYFTGYKEPHALLLLFKEMQTAPDGRKYNELFFVQKRNAAAERWTGRRLGIEGVKERLGMTDVFNGEEFTKQAPDLGKFDRILGAPLPEDLAFSADPGSQYQLMTRFQQVAGIEADARVPVMRDLLRFRNALRPANLAQIQKNIAQQVKDEPRFASSRYVTQFLALKDSSDIVRFRADLDRIKYTTVLFDSITNALREIKTPEEKILLRKAVEISCRAQNEVMRTARADMSELEIQGLHEYIHKHYGAESVGYGSIIGSGENGCILHYTENTRTRVGTDLILMDVGAEYHGYTADVTRTIPAKGKFSAEERAIYQIVYDAQEAAFKTLKDGATWQAANTAARDVIADGLLKLGIIKSKAEVGKYYPHGLGHHIGLDVHDKSNYGQLKEDMIITIEPGIYIPSNSDCDKKWWGLSVRIEDDALITRDGYELLSHFAPRSIADIEKMMAEKSVLDNFKLPSLESGKGKKSF